ncbi:MAG: hypothetical protein FJ279_10385 [Planctomycetes bacterium]|nr:hypothetical protein [Planctomycetota bacterium]MBM4080653.1 hypothetical protein [Planctomycetota bacterium]MBM4083808.1 hypothetical protein [Planctomycetota bacterium]
MPPTTIGPPMTLEQLKETVLANNRKVLSFQARCEISISGPNIQGSPLRCNGYIVMLKPKHFKIHISKTLAPTLLEAVSDGDTFWVYVPDEKTIWTGRCDRPRTVEATGMVIYPDDIANMFDLSDAFYGKVPVMEIHPNHQTVTMLDVTADTVRMRSRMTVLRVNQQVSMYQMFDPDGQMRIQGIFRDWIKISGGVVPRTILLNWPQSDITITLALPDPVETRNPRDLTVNDPTIVPSLFKLAPPKRKDVQVRDLDRPGEPAQLPEAEKPKDKKGR